MATTPTFDQFRTEALAAGFEEVLERRWGPNYVLDTHTHPFELSALVVEGDMWLTADNETRHLRAGDRFALPREAPHAERYGPRGATYWVARRTAPRT